MRAIAFYIRNELKAPEAARNTVKVIFDAIFGLDTFPNKVRLTEDEPWKKVIVTDVIYVGRDQVDAMADMPMT